MQTVINLYIMHLSEEQKHEIERRFREIQRRAESTYLALLSNPGIVRSKEASPKEARAIALSAYVCSVEFQGTTELFRRGYMDGSDSLPGVAIGHPSSGGPEVLGDLEEFLNGSTAEEAN